MPNKIKIFFGFLALIALFSVYSVFNSFSGKPVPVAVIGAQTPLPNPDADPDHDGLTNREEAIWNTDPFNPDTDGDGFKDGEEVASGHNPLVPGPNDLINADNLTQKFSELAFSGFVAGDLKQNSPNYGKAIGDISSSITDSGKSTLYKKINSSALNIIDSNSTTDINYFKEIRSVAQEFGSLITDQYKTIENNLNIISNQGFNDQIKNYFQQKAVSSDSLLKQGLSIPVPKHFADEAGTFLTLIQRMRDVSDAVAHGDADPIKAMLALSALTNISSDYIALIDAYTQKINQYHTPTDVFQN